MTHTPEPWFNVEPDASAPSRARVCSIGGANIYDAPLTGETAANAALIAAAPDLRKALRVLIDPRRAPQTPSDTHCLLGSTRDYCLEHEAEFDRTSESCPVSAARDALAKADGR